MGFEASHTDNDMSGEDLDDNDVDDDDDVFASSFAPYGNVAPPLDPFPVSRPVSMARRHTTAIMPSWSGPGIQPVHELPAFPRPDLYSLGEHSEAAASFWGPFCHYLEGLAACFRSLRFDQFEVQVSTPLDAPQHTLLITSAATFGLNDHCKKSVPLSTLTSRSPWTKPWP